MRKERLRRSRNRFGEGGEIASEKKERKPDADRRKRRGNQRGERGEEIEEGGGETETDVSLRFEMNFSVLKVSCFQVPTI